MKHFNLIALSLLVSSTSVQAGFIDFTSSAWDVGQDSNNYYTLAGSGISLSSTGGNLTFNDSDGASGCGGNITDADNTIRNDYHLACIGDGIGIGNDEITQRSQEALTVTFLNGPVNILDIHFLDLFINNTQGNTNSPVEREIAVLNFDSGINMSINSISTDTTDYAGGYWESSWDSDWSVQNDITSFTLSGNLDDFSDYSLARIEYETANVPEPSILALMGLGLLGLGLTRRRMKK